MIKSWQHKGLKQFYLSADKSGIRPEHAKRLTLILQLLDVAEQAIHMRLPGMDFHELKGSLSGYYSVKVSGNWRVIFKIEKHHVVLVDYLDYH